MPRGTFFFVNASKEVGVSGETSPRQGNTPHGRNVGKQNSFLLKQKAPGRAIHHPDAMLLFIYASICIHMYAHVCILYEKCLEMLKHVRIMLKLTLFLLLCRTILFLFRRYLLFLLRSIVLDRSCGPKLTKKH